MANIKSNFGTYGDKHRKQQSRCIFSCNFGRYLWITSPKFNVAPEKWWLEVGRWSFPFGMAYFQGRTVKLPGSTTQKGLDVKTTTGVFSEKPVSFSSTSTAGRIILVAPMMSCGASVLCFIGREVEQESWAVFKTLVGYLIEGIILPNYMGIIIRQQYKDPYKPISIMECHSGFERCSVD